MAKIKRQDWYSIPNLLSYLRIILVPLFVWVYYQAETINDYYCAAGIIVVSGLTDFFDGKIARRFNMITELGKFIDPVADKLTQCALIFCFATRYSLMWFLVAIFMVKESFMAIAGMLMLRQHKKLDGAMWYGKVSTFVFYVVMIILLLWPMIPITYANILIVICSVFLTYSFVMYAVLYYKMWRGAV